MENQTELCQCWAIDFRFRVEVERNRCMTCNKPINLKIMTLSQKQRVFSLNLAKLIVWTYQQEGHELTMGEVLRTPEQQALYVAQKKSKTSNSKHLEKLAADLNLFIGGVYRTDKEAYKQMAQYWKSLHPDNVAGYDWGWDANHFEMK